MEVETASDVGAVHLLDHARSQVQFRVREGALGAWLHSEPFALVVVADAEVSIG